MAVFVDANGNVVHSETVTGAAKDGASAPRTTGLRGIQRRATTGSAPERLAAAGTLGAVRIVYYHKGQKEKRKDPKTGKTVRQNRRTKMDLEQVITYDKGEGIE